MIRREAEVTALEILEEFPCLGIIGPRQIGKTTLARILSKKIQKETIYLDLESPQDIQKIENAETYFRSFEDACIIIDEVQRMKTLFPILRSVIDRKRESARFIILGSASPELIRESSESLAGRIAYLELEGLSCSELGWRYQDKRWLNGGYPDPLLKIKNKTLWFENYVKTYVERDLPLLGLPAQPNTTHRLLNMIASMQGSTLNYSSISKSLELTDKTIKRYIDFLEESFLLFQLSPYNANVKKRLVKAKKAYITDTGLLHYLLGVDKLEVLFNNPLIGVSWEGFAIGQMRNALPPTGMLHFYRTHQGQEVDVVILKSEIPVAAVEIKFGDKILPSSGNKKAAEDLGTQHNFLVHSNSETRSWKTKDNWQICSLQTFIEDSIPNLFRN